MTSYPTSTPAAERVDAAGLLAFVDALEADPRIEPHGLIVHRHGKRICEGYWAPHGAGDQRLLYSLSKTFTGTALGIAVGEGRLALDDLVSAYLPAQFAGADERLRGLRIRHIASMATGHDRETLLEARAIDPDDVIRAFLTIPPETEPGGRFAYNQPPVIAVATIVQKLAGARLVDYLRSRLFDPLGIGDVHWATLRPGIDLGFSGVYTNLDAVARLGQLYLDDGVWNRRRILPEGWVQAASSAQVANPEREEPDWRQGYGFQLWCSRHGYRGDGALGQYMIVLPEHDVTIAMFSCTEFMQRVLDLAWQHLLPAFDREPVAGADETLDARLANLVQPTAMSRTGGTPVPTSGARFVLAPAGDADPSFTPHRTITAVEWAGDRIVVREGDLAIDAPLTVDWSPNSNGKLSASAAAQADGSIVVDLVVLETPHRLTLVLRPGAGVFESRWSAAPLFGAGIDKFLARMHAPG